MRTRILAHTMAMCVGLALLGSVPASAGEPEQAQHEHQAQAPQQDQAKGRMKMQGPNTERLAALMARVNATRGDEKVAAMTDVIAILVEERAAMQEHCAAMHGTTHK